MNVEWFKQKRTWLVAVAVAAIVGLILVPDTALANGGDDDERKVTICHAAGLDGTTKFVEITVSRNAVYKDQGGHFYENGTPQAGHEDDIEGPCPVPPTTTAPPTTTTPPPTTTTPPPTTTRLVPPPLVVVFGNDCVTGTAWLDFTSVSDTDETVRVSTVTYYLHRHEQLRVNLQPLGNGRFMVGPTFGSSTGPVVFQFPANFIAVNGLGDFAVACNVAVPVVKQPTTAG